jgi:alpha-ribazole phosphatase
VLRLYFIRHGQTPWNKELRYNGSTDTTLTPLGERQAAALTARLRTVHLDAIVTSDRQRSIDTARALAEQRQLELEQEPLWREVDYGQAEGLRWADVVERFPAAAHSWAANEASAAMPDGESLLAVHQRVVAALARVTQQRPQGTVAIVAHGGPLRVALCVLTGLPVTSHWQFNLQPASISEVALYPTGAVINLLNDTCHLRGRSL